MPKWRRGQKEFTVKVTYHESRGCQTYIPKPIIEMLGNPASIRFIIKDKKIEVERVVIN